MQKTCSIEGCAGKHSSRGLCRRHYSRFIVSPQGRAVAKKLGKKNCDTPDCPKPHFAKGHCSRHYSQLLYKNIEARARRAASVAKTRGWEWGLSSQFYEMLLMFPCHYCDGPVEPGGVGLDRIRSHEGYIPGNVVACCLKCNTAKSDLSKKEFFAHLTKMAATCLTR